MLSLLTNEIVFINAIMYHVFLLGQVKNNLSLVSSLPFLYRFLTDHHIK